jgi:hypothetical protein
MDNLIKNKPSTTQQEATTGGLLMHNLEGLEKAALGNDLRGVIDTLGDLLGMCGGGYKRADSSIWHAKDRIPVRRAVCALVGYIHDVAVKLKRGKETRQHLAVALRKLSTVIKYLERKARDCRTTRKLKKSSGGVEAERVKLMVVRKWIEQTAKGCHLGEGVTDILDVARDMDLDLPYDPSLLWTVYSEGQNRLVASLMLEMVETVSDQLMEVAEKIGGAEAVERTMCKVNGYLIEEATAD